MIKKILATAVVASAVLAGNISYATKEKPVYLDADSKRVAGKLLPTNAIEVLEELGDRIKFRIEGYQHPDTGSVIYFTDKARIFSLAFARTSNPEMKVINDSVGDGWSIVSVEAYTTKGDFEDDLEPMFERASKLYSDNCSMCHSLHTVDHYNANQWPSTFKSMLDRTPIEKDDVWLITQYLQKHASDMK
ncbi:MAG: cytochrome C [Campylobacteraceae bacterium]|nr:cytochrome C [Campylobacteraceae bacterium]